MFGLRDRFGARVVDPFGGIPLGFATEEEARAHARPGDQVTQYGDTQPSGSPLESCPGSEA